MEWNFNDYQPIEMEGYSFSPKILIKLTLRKNKITCFNSEFKVAQEELIMLTVE